MRKIFFVFAFFLFIFLSSSTPTPVKAGGSCECYGSGAGDCAKSLDECTGDDVPTCWVSGGYCGCTCEPSSTPKPAQDPLEGCPDGKSINSAIGCIPVLGSKEEFLSFVLKWAVGIGGGIAFLLIIYGGFMIMTSAGNPERIKAGQELLTSAVSGLILLILSIFVLRIIGVDILGIPGFGK